jgi:hypothetical protein
MPAGGVHLYLAAKWAARLLSELMWDQCNIPESRNAGTIGSCGLMSADHFGHIRLGFGRLERVKIPGGTSDFIIEPAVALDTYIWVA